MKKFGGTVKIKSITKSWRTRHLSQSEGPACEFFRTTTNKRFGTTGVAYTQQLLTDCPDRLTRSGVQNRPSRKMQNKILFATMIESPTVAVFGLKYRRSSSAASTFHLLCQCSL